MAKTLKYIIVLMSPRINTLSKLFLDGVGGIRQNGAADSNQCKDFYFQEKYSAQL